MSDEDDISTWRILINECAKDDEIIVNTLSEEELDVAFNPGYGGSEGKPFTAWSKLYVYFPVVYDGSEWVERVLRHVPSDLSAYTPPDHFGGE